MSQENARASALPLHRKIALSIHADIVQRNLSPHTKISSEVALAKQYGVSHGTITKALETLVHAKVLYRQRPQGTFVAESPALYSLPSLIDHQHLSDKAHPIPTPAHPAISPPLIGIIMPQLGSIYLDGIVTSVETVTRSFGYGLSFASTENDVALERYHVEQFLRQGVAGIILFPAEHAIIEQDGILVSAPGGEERIDYLRQLQEQGVPVIIVDRYVPEIDCNYVISDDFSAGYASTQHLIALGHTRIGFITASYFLTSSLQRYKGYKQCLQDYAIPFDEQLVLHSLMHPGIPIRLKQPIADLPDSEDRARIIAYLSMAARPAAVVTMNDVLALRVLQAAETIGLDIPGEMALVCSGETGIGEFLRVPLTSIVQPVEEIGRQSANILLNLIAGRFSGVRHITLPVSFIMRRSSGSHPNKVPQLLPLREQ